MFSKCQSLGPWPKYDNNIDNIGMMFNIHHKETNLELVRESNRNHEQRRY